MFTYQGHLSLQASVPEAPYLEKHFKQSITFDIFCPIDGCNTIKANGKDHKFKIPVQGFVCNKHKTYFYAHTSWLMVKLTEILIQRIILAIFSSSVSSREIADRYHLSSSTISNLIVNCKSYVDTVLNTINEDKKRFDLLDLPILLQSVIWIDETFFKVGNTSWILILAIDYNGNVLGWKFGKTRTAADIIDVLQQTHEKMPDWNVIIGDGANAYPNAIRSFRKRAFLIQQFHTHPWEKVRITEFTSIGKYKVREDIIELDYTAFINDEPQIGYAIQKEITVNKPSKKRGRKKGQKNGTGKKKYGKVKEKNKKKRGPKTARGSGRAFQFGHIMDFLKIEWLTANPNDVKIPDEEAVSRMLNTTFMIFSNKAIQSNRIESHNNQIKRVIPDRGLQNEKHLNNRITRAIQINNRDIIDVSSSMSLPISSKLGFINLNQFFIPNISKFQLIRGWNSM